MSSKKEHLIQELKELRNIFLYLTVSFAFLETVRSLILTQVGVHAFVHGYITALVEALALSKIVMLAQRIPVLNAFEKHPLLVSALAKACLMTIIVSAGGALEEHLFSKHVAEAPLREHVVIAITHIISLFMVFFPLFIVRGLSVDLGPGKLAEYLMTPVKSAEETAKV